MAKNLNPENSSLKQMCLDAMNCGMPEFMELYEKYEKNELDKLKAADAEFKTHRYPEDSLKWVKLKNFENCKALSQLSTITGGVRSLSVLMLLIQNVNQNLLVQCSISDFAHILGITKKTVANALNQLLEYGYIVVVRPSTSKASAIYMVNPDIVLLGTGVYSVLASEYEYYISLNNEEIIDENGQVHFTPAMNYSLLSDRHKNCSTTYSRFRDEDGEFVVFNSIIVNEKKPTQKKE